MSKREKIIIVVMIAACIFAAANFTGFLDPAKEGPSSKAEMEEIDSFSTALSQQIMQKSLSRTDIHTLKLAQEQWHGNPFQMPETVEPLEELPGEMDEADESGSIQYIYSGYIKAGNRILCIINGMEYESGEYLGEYRVTEITPKKVIAAKNDREIVLLLAE
ncbi:MAG: hypothetical protein GY737_00825 [Desulfobacteraceae bacterium]|nr:hypothetical protein [Desulfobacteraceae bacterium]